MMPAPVVYDISVLVNAAADEESDFLTWPVLPPRTGNPAADCVGIANDHHEFSLWLSPHLLDNTRRVLIETGWTPQTADRYLDVLEEISVGSGGQLVSPERTVHDCPDHEDNLILDLAAHSGAVLIVSDDADLTLMSPWRATPVMRPHEFASRVDVARRAQRTAPTPTTRRLEGRAAGPDARSRQDVDSPMTEYGPDDYRQLRERFDRDYGRLTEIVDGWDPRNRRLRERIRIWHNNLATFQARITALDNLADDNPDIAYDALEKLAEKMIFALTRLEPQYRTPTPTIIEHGDDLRGSRSSESDKGRGEPEL